MTAQARAVLGLALSPGGEIDDVLNLHHRVPWPTVPRVTWNGSRQDTLGCGIVFFIRHPTCSFSYGFGA